MRSEEINGVIVEYPDMESFCFSAMPVIVKGYGGTFENPDGGTHINVILKNVNTSEVLSEKRNLFNGDCFFDLSYYARTMFDTDTIRDVDYATTMSAMTSINLEVTVELWNGETKDNELVFTTTVIWGALNAGEVFQNCSEFKYYRNLPFVFSVYHPFENSGLIANVTGVYADDVQVQTYKGDRGIKNFIKSVGQSANKVEFVAEYFTELVTTTFIADDCTDGVYLRWVDRQGFIRHWLFKSGEGSYEVKDRLDVKRSDVYGDTVRRITKAESKSFKVCAPLVDSYTFDMLAEVMTSPLVDMYIGTEDDVPQWMPVNVKSETVVKTKAVLQDLEFSVMLPETKIQSV